MPGPVSDSYDPEFGTGENVRKVARAIKKQLDVISHTIGKEPRDILEVIHGENGGVHEIKFSERSLRIIRFALNRALKSI